MAIVLKRKAETNLSVEQEHYSDFFTNLSVHPTKNDLYREINEEAVKSSIRNLLLTNRGERIYNSSLGSDIRTILFENFSTATESVLSDLVRNTISNFEPRANVLQVYVNSEIDEHSIFITIVFNIINREEPITLELILNRIR